MLVYGKNVAKELLENNKIINNIYLQDNFDDKNLISLIQSRNLPYKICKKQEMDNLCSGLNQGIILSIPDYKYGSFESIVDNIE